MNSAEQKGVRKGDAVEFSWRGEIRSGQLERFCHSKKSAVVKSNNEEIEMPLGRLQRPGFRWFPR